MNKLDKKAIEELEWYFNFCSPKWRQPHYLIYNPKSMSFWLVPGEAKIFENAVPLSKAKEDLTKIMEILKVKK